jgi:hypothetical protein
VVAEGDDAPARKDMKNAADLALEKAKISAKETRKQAPSSRRRSPPVDQREANEDMMMMTVEEAIGSSVRSTASRSASGRTR